jgi:hypothetical protein
MRYLIISNRLQEKTQIYIFENQVKMIYIYYIEIWNK